MKLIKCKYCGKKGIGCKEIKLSGGSIFSKQDEYCKYCKEYNLGNDDLKVWHDFAWQLWEKNRLTKKDIYIKKLSRLLSMKYRSGKSIAELGIFSPNDIVEICNSNKKLNLPNIKHFENIINQRAKDKQDKELKKKENVKRIKEKTGAGMSWVYNLIPETIWGVLLYVGIIALCIYLLGDSGYECGVDYAPRFFGEC